MDDFGILFLSIALILLIGFAVFSFLSSRNAKKEWENERKETIAQIYALAGNSLEVSPKEFMEFRKKASRIGFDRNLPGVYVLYNKSKNLYYIGQGKRVFDRVNSHFTGHGNGDVYADYKYGDCFTVRIISLERSGCATLNELERKTIFAYDSVAHGYNKTHGNRD